MNTIRTLVIQFANELSAKEIPLFRGAVIQSMEESNILFHNHTPDGFRYSYPLIQYKRIKGKAAIVCINEGADTIGQFITNYDKPLIVGERVVMLDIGRVFPTKIRVQAWTDPFTYHIQNWLPLNSKNYKSFKDISDEQEKKAFLANILKANIISMMKGLDIKLDDEIKLDISWLSNSKVLQHKGILMTAFNAVFRCNVSIPNYIGLGKSASLGFGTVFLKKKTEQTDDEHINDNDVNNE